MLDALAHLLNPRLCRHNWPRPTNSKSIVNYYESFLINKRGSLNLCCVVFILVFCLELHMLKEHLQPLGLISARLPLLHKCYYFHFSSPFVKFMENSNQSRAHFTSRRPWLVDFIFSLYCKGLTGSVLYVVCIKDSNWLCLIRHCSSSYASYACGQLFPLICTSCVRVYYNLLSHFPFVPF